MLHNPEVPPPIPGIDMATGAQDGFFGPTNKENASGAVWHNFITKESKTLKRPQFAGKGGRPDTNDNGHTSAAAKALIPDLTLVRPIDFFNLMIPKRFVERIMVNCTNTKAAADGSGAGGTLYTDFVPFDVPEMYSFISLLFAN